MTKLNEGEISMLERSGFNEADLGIVKYARRAQGLFANPKSEAHRRLNRLIKEIKVAGGGKVGTRRTLAKAIRLRKREQELLGKTAALGTAGKNTKDKSKAAKDKDKLHAKSLMKSGPGRDDVRMGVQEGLSAYGFDFWDLDLSEHSSDSEKEERRVARDRRRAKGEADSEDDEESLADYDPYVVDEIEEFLHLLVGDGEDEDVHGYQDGGLLGDVDNLGELWALDEVADYEKRKALDPMAKPKSKDELKLGMRRKMAERHAMRLAKLDPITAKQVRGKMQKKAAGKVKETMTMMAYLAKLLGVGDLSDDDMSQYSDDELTKSGEKRKMKKAVKGLVPSDEEFSEMDTNSTLTDMSASGEMRKMGLKKRAKKGLADMMDGADGSSSSSGVDIHDVMGGEFYGKAMEQVGQNREEIRIRILRLVQRRLRKF